MTTAQGITYTAPDFYAGATAPVNRDGKYCGVVVRERTEAGSWDFQAYGPYGNAQQSGLYSVAEAAHWLAGHDDNGFEII